MRLNQVVRAALLLAVVFAVGCTSENKGKIEGTKWSSNATTIKGQAVPAGLLRLEFTPEGKLNYAAGPVNFTGTYSLGMSTYVTFNLDQELSGRKNHVEKITITGDKLVMTDSDGTALEFTKVGGGPGDQKDK